MVKTTRSWGAEISKAVWWWRSVFQEFNVSLTLQPCEMVLPFLLASILTLPSADAQSDYLNRTLVVVIPSQRKSISALEAEHRARPTSRRISKNLERKKKEQEQFEHELLQAMRQAYQVTDWGFISDSTLSGYTQRELLTVFKSDGSARDVRKSELWFLRRDKAVSGAEGLILCDERGEPIPRPFPGFYRLNRFTAILESFFGGGTHAWKPLTPLITKMNSKLESYFD